MGKNYKYYPQGFKMWDAWFVNVNNEIHMFHLQRAGKNPTEQDKITEEFIGHAISKDGVNFQQLPVTEIGPRVNIPTEDLRPWTGCAFYEGNRSYLYYTMRGSKTDGRTQSTALAYTDSQDLTDWKFYSNNPLFTPDPKYYVSVDKPMVNNKVDCRDLYLVPQKIDGWYYGFYAACIQKEFEGQIAVIACVRTKDLLNFQQLPPAFVPGIFGEVEVPYVTKIGNKWVMTCLTSSYHGSRLGFSDENVLFGTIYATADQIQGPYTMDPNDNVLCGGASALCGASVRGVRFQNKELVYNICTQNGQTFLSQPYEIKQNKNGKIRLYEAMEECYNYTPYPIQATEQIIWTHKTGGHPSGMYKKTDYGYNAYAPVSFCIMNYNTIPNNCRIHITMKSKDARAMGIALRYDFDNYFLDNNEWAIILDNHKKIVTSTSIPSFINGFNRQATWDTNEDVTMKIKLISGFVEIYVNDELILAHPIQLKNSDPTKLGLALYAENGTVDFSNIKVEKF